MVCKCILLPYCKNTAPQTVIPQTISNTIRQTLSTTIPQTPSKNYLSTTLPQTISNTIPQTLSTIIPLTISNSYPSNILNYYPSTTIPQTCISYPSNILPKARYIQNHSQTKTSQTLPCHQDRYYPRRSRSSRRPRRGRSSRSPRSRCRADHQHERR